MMTRRSTRAPRQLPPAGPETPAAPGTTSDDAALDAQLTDLITQFGGAGYRVRVDRRDARGNGEYLGTLDLTLELEDVVMQRWGGGQYRGRIVDAAGSYKSSIRFGIAGAPRDPETRVSVPATAEPSGLAVILESQRAIVAALTELTRTMNAPRAEQGDPVDRVVAIAKALKEVSGGAPSGSPSDTIALIREVLALREEVAGGAADNGTSDLAVAIRDGVRPLIQLAQTKLDTDRQMAQTRRHSAAAPVATVPADPVAQLAARLPLPARVFLANVAKNNGDPSLYAEMSLDQLPGDVQAALPGMLADPAFADRLVAAVPQFQPYREWFHGYAAALREHVTQLESPDGAADSDDGRSDDDADQQHVS